MICLLKGKSAKFCGVSRPTSERRTLTHFEYRPGRESLQPLPFCSAQISRPVSNIVSVIKKQKMPKTECWHLSTLQISFTLQTQEATSLRSALSQTAGDICNRTADPIPHVGRGAQKLSSLSTRSNFIISFNQLKYIFRPPFLGNTPTKNETVHGNCTNTPHQICHCATAGGDALPNGTLHKSYI